MKKTSYVAVVKEYPMRRAFDLLVISVAMVLLGIVAGIALQSQIRSGYDQAPTTSATIQPTNQAGAIVSGQAELYRSIYARVNPSVVSIRIPMRNLPVNSDSGLPGSNQPYQVAAGSGFVHVAGQTVTLTVLRNGKQQDMQVEVAARSRT
jgi:S1-C subfamily serine protease